MTLAAVPAAIPAVVLIHAILSWPAMVPRYANPYVWRLTDVPIKAALRKVPEQEFLLARLPAIEVAWMLDRHVPPSDTVYAFSEAPIAYTNRRVVTGYHSALANRLKDTLWTGFTPGFQARKMLRFQFHPRRLRRLRIVQVASRAEDPWSVAELRVYQAGHEMPRGPLWRLRAGPNPWEVQLAFDNSDVTRWWSAAPRAPGQYIELDFGRAETPDELTITAGEDQFAPAIRLQAEVEGGAWKWLDTQGEQSDVNPQPGQRRQAILALEDCGIEWLLVGKDDFGADDFRLNAPLWGITEVEQRGGTRLFRLEYPAP